MRCLVSLAFAAAAAIATVTIAPLASASNLAVTQGPQVVYTFDRESAAGIEGAITIQHNADTSAAAAWVLASLDFSALAIDDVRKSDPQCKNITAVREFQYHIHVDWHNKGSRTSDAFAGCAKPATGNHYDPLRACGPSSEFAGTPACEGKAALYKCTPERYSQDPHVCEKGDVSGKLGHLKVDTSGFAGGEWKDLHFPLLAERSPQWSIVLHAVCGSATPRVACAVGVQRSALPRDDTVDDGISDDDDAEFPGQYEDYWTEELRA